MSDSIKKRYQVKGFVGWNGGGMDTSDFPEITAEDQQI